MTAERARRGPTKVETALESRPPNVTLPSPSFKRTRPEYNIETMAPPTSILSAAESSFILDALVLPTPVRADGRPLGAFRAFSLATAVAPQANGSARVLLGGGAGGGPGTEVVTAVRLEVGPAAAPGGGDGASSVGARPDVVCSVEWCVASPSSFASLSSLDAIRGRQAADDQG